MKNFTLCLCRDAKAQPWVATAPAGKVREGMYVRLIDGTLLLVETIASPNDLPQATEVLKSVWVDGND